MASLFLDPAASPAQPKPRRSTRSLHADQTHASHCAPFDDGRKITKPHQHLATGNPPTRLIPLTDWNLHHSWPPIGGLRHLVFFEKTNGFHQVVRRVGRRVLIDEAAFFAWVDSNGGRHASV